MSSNSTGTSKRRTSDERIDEALKSGADAYLEEALALTGSSLIIQGGSAAYGSFVPGGGEIESSGDTFFGALAFNPVITLVDAGRINISPNQSGASVNSSYVLVTGQGSPDDIFFIDGADKNGQILIYQGTETQIQTLKHANITLITSISGTGTVTVQTSTDHGYTTGLKVNIVSTTNFTIQNVAITVTGADTFEYTATGNITPESTGFVQPGNMVMPDGQDVILDATVAANGIPIAAFIFDPTVEAFGAWRLLFTSIQTGGSGGSSIIENIQLGNVSSPPDLDIDLNSGANQRNFLFELIGDTIIAFINDTIPGTETYPFEMTITQGAIAFALTFPASVVNTIDVSQPDTTFIVVFQTNDGGTTYSAFVAGSKSSGAVIDVSQWSTFPAVSVVDFATNGATNVGALTGVTGIDLDGATALIQGVKELRFFDDDPDKNIQSAVDELSYNVPALDQHSFYAGGVEIARFEEISASLYRLDMLDHQIKDAKHISFDVAATLAISGAVPAIGYDSSATELIYNAPAGTAHTWSFNLIDSMFLTTNNLAFKDGFQVIFNPDATNPGVNIGLAVGDPSATNDGDLWYNSSTNKFRTKENGVNVDVVGGSGEFFGPWTANHDAGNFALNNVSSIQISDSIGGVHGLLQGLVTPEVRLTLTAGEKFSIFDNITNILEIDNTTGLTMLGTHVINMGNNIINTISELQFSNANLHTPSNENTIAFDSGDDALKYSVALTTDSHRFYANTDLLASFSRIGVNQGQLSVEAVVAEILQANDNVAIQNGFQIQNTSSTITTFAIPANELLIFADDGVNIGQYNADIDNWLFNPANDVQLSPSTDIDLTPGGDIIMNPTGDIRVFDDLDMDGVNTIDMGTSASSGSNIPAVADGYFQIKLNGITKFVPFFNTLP